MEKYKTIILIEKIRKCLEEGKPHEALSIAEGIDKKKLKNMSDLSVVAESYFQNMKYEEARKLYIKISQKTPSRRIIAQLVHLSIKLNDIEEAKRYLAEFIRIAPKDFYQYIFRYSIDKMAQAPLVKLIEDLVDLKNAEYIESWAYELAKLYHKAGMKDECLAECDDIVLWFGSGEYVERAKALRAYYRGEIQIEEEVIVTKPEEIETSTANDKTTSSNEENDYEYEVNDVDNDDDVDRTNIDEIFMEENVEGFAEGHLEDINLGHLEEKPEVDLDENLEVDLEENLEVDLEENPEVDLEENLEVDLEETSEGNLEGNLEENVEGKINEIKERAFETNLQQNKKLDEDDFFDLESALAEQLEFTFQEEEKLIEKEVKQEASVNVALQFQDELITEIENEFGVKLQDEFDAESKSMPNLTDSVCEEDEADPLDQEATTKEASAHALQNTEIEKEVKEEIRRLLKEKDFSEIAVAMEITAEIDSTTKQTSKESEEKHSSKKQKKINLKVLSNEQLIGEDEEDLLLQLTKNQVSLLDIYGNFMRMEVVRKQLVRSMDQILTQRSKNVIITGEPQSGKTRLAKCYAKWLHRMKLIQSTKIALINGEKLNHMNLLTKKEQLKDCVIIIENAGVIASDTMKALLELSNLYQNNIAIILEDSREKINRLLRSNSQLNSIFNNRIHLHKYTLEDYMGFAYDYITERDYEIEMEAFIALQNEFTEFMHKKRENALQAIFSYLDNIMQKSEKRSSEQLKILSQTGHFAETDLMVVKKEDIKS